MDFARAHTSLLSRKFLAKNNTVIISITHVTILASDNNFHLIYLRGTTSLKLKECAQFGTSKS